MKILTYKKFVAKAAFAAICFLLLTHNVNAQLSNYTFKDSTITYQPITGGTVLGFGGDAPGTVYLHVDSDGDGNLDDGATGTEATGEGYPIGFNFTFNGVSFDRFGAATNGFITLGKSSATPSVMFNENNIEGLPDISNPLSEIVSFFDATSANPITSDFRNRISALGMVLQSDDAELDSKIRYETIGTSPDRELVVQWESFTFFGSTSTDINLQIRLHETSNIIDFVYNMVTGVDTGQGLSYTAEIGLGGFLVSDNSAFINRTVSGTSPDWTATSAGTVVSASCTINENMILPPGTLFRFDPFGVGISESAYLNGINIYPNPASDELTITLDDLNTQEDIILSITDIQGREVYRESITNANASYTKKLDVSNFSKGMYLVKITAGNKSGVKKLVLQ